MIEHEAPVDCKVGAHSPKRHVFGLLEESEENQTVELFAYSAKKVLGPPTWGLNPGHSYCEATVLQTEPVILQCEYVDANSVYILT